eukprot:g49877.t1
METLHPSPPCARWVWTSVKLSLQCGEWLGKKEKKLALVEMPLGSCVLALFSRPTLRIAERVLQMSKPIVRKVQRGGEGCSVSTYLLFPPPSLQLEKPSTAVNATLQLRSCSFLPNHSPHCRESFTEVQTHRAQGGEGCSVSIYLLFPPPAIGAEIEASFCSATGVEQ